MNVTKNSRGEKLLGFNYAEQHNQSTQYHATGTRIECDDGTVLQYVKAGANITAGNAVKLANSNTPYDAVVHTAAATDVVHGVALDDITSGKYGFVVLRGLAKSVNVATGVAAGDKLIATSTAGRLGPYANTDVVPPAAQALTAESSNTASIFLRTAG